MMNVFALFLLAAVGFLFPNADAIFIQIFNKTKAYELSITGVNASETDYSSYFFVNNRCSRVGFKDYEYGFYTYTNAEASIYQSTGYNLCFMLNVTFEAELRDGYELKFFNSDERKISCIRFLRKKSLSPPENETLLRFQLMIKDPDLIKMKNYAFHFGKVGISGIRCLENGNVKIHPFSRELISIGILNSHSFDLDSAKRDETHCGLYAALNTCYEIHTSEDNNEKRLILVHWMPETVSKTIHRFGQAKDFHAPVVSHETELVKGHSLKIIDGIKEHKFLHLLNFFEKAYTNCNSKYDETNITQRIQQIPRAHLLKMSQDFVSRQCSVKKFSFNSTRFVSIFHNRSIPSVERLNINDFLPTLSVHSSLKPNKTLHLKLNDHHGLFLNQNLNMSFDCAIRTHDAVIKHTIHDATEVTVDLLDEAANSVSIEVTPRANSIYCPSGECPHLERNHDTVSCNRCKKAFFNYFF